MKVHHLHRGDQVRAAWSMFDHDGDGHITLEELGQLYSSLGQHFSQVSRFISLEVAVHRIGSQTLS